MPHVAPLGYYLEPEPTRQRTDPSADFWDVTENDFDAVLDVNLKGVFFATQAFVQQRRAAGRPGKVINISSVHEELAFPNFAAYCASKGGVRMLTRTLAVELGPLGITINSIAPGAGREAGVTSGARLSVQLVRPPRLVPHLRL